MNASIDCVEESRTPACSLRKYYFCFTLLKQCLINFRSQTLICAFASALTALPPMAPGLPFVLPRVVSFSFCILIRETSNSYCTYCIKFIAGAVEVVLFIGYLRISY